jgi:hypothetical protein
VRLVIERVNVFERERAKSNLKSSVDRKRTRHRKGNKKRKPQEQQPNKKKKKREMEEEEEEINVGCYHC